MENKQKTDPLDDFYQFQHVMQISDFLFLYYFKRLHQSNCIDYKGKKKKKKGAGGNKKLYK